MKDALPSPFPATVGEGSNEVRRELLWWRRCAVVLLAARLTKEVSANEGRNKSASSATNNMAARRTQVLAGDDELLSIAGRMADLGGSGQGVFRHIVTFL